VTRILLYTAIGEGFRKGDESPMVPAAPEDRKFASMWWKHVVPFFEAGKIALSKVKLMDGGLKGVEDGLQIGRDRAIVGGSKLVYRL